eukprot:TRINITY_DN11699_c1_g1_i1.p2 TRINITY_DN11699_c1_g1~~TRINITY_DN11699_c1_g1_i1.p2  ORF type:complete len:219 (+),score=-19.54 TRINITY_DN11699_c1_g1_i1:153-809(+)
MQHQLLDFLTQLNLSFFQKKCKKFFPNSLSYTCLNSTVMAEVFVYHKPFIQYLSVTRSFHIVVFIATRSGLFLGQIVLGLYIIRVNNINSPYIYIWHLRFLGLQEQFLKQKIDRSGTSVGQKLQTTNFLSTTKERVRQQKRVKICSWILLLFLYIAMSCFIICCVTCAVSDEQIQGLFCQTKKIQFQDLFEQKYKFERVQIQLQKNIYRLIVKKQSFL